MPVLPLLNGNGVLTVDGNGNGNQKMALFCFFFCLRPQGAVSQFNFTMSRAYLCVNKIEINFSFYEGMKPL